MSGDPRPDGSDTPPAGLPGFIERAPWRRLPHPLRWITTALIGGTLILAGVAMLVLPGPGLVSIALGLMVLGTEFVWARVLLQRMEAGGRRGWEWTRSRVRRTRTSEPPGDA